MTERECLAALYSFVPFGPARMSLLVSYFGGAKKAWRASSKELLEIGLKEKIVSNFLIFREAFSSEEYFDRLKRLSVEFVTHTDPDYPENLGDLDDSPTVLYIKGTLKKSDTDAVAIVGSRKMTSYGREVTENFASELASLGVTIVSGLARGIDTVAHSAALESGGRTIAVLGCGLDKMYPPENTSLAKNIIKDGAVVSEYPLGYPALPTNFASRNRIISGLSKAIVVIEGLEKSGTLLTASAAAEQGRCVFAVPGQITSPMSQAPLFLLQNGARMATKVSDILGELNLQLNVDREKVEEVMPTDAIEAQLTEIIANESLHLDEIARISSLKVSDISAKLTVMELKGMVKNLGGGVYKKV